MLIMKALLNKIYTALVWNFILLTGIFVLMLLFVSKAYCQDLSTSFDAKVPLGYKVVPNDEICTKPNPCPPKPTATPTPEPTTENQIKELDKQLKFDCPPCRKSTPQTKIVEKIVEKPVYKTIERNIEVPKYIDKIVEKVKLVDVEKLNYFYLTMIYGQDGIFASNPDESGYIYDAETYESVLFGGGYTRFIPTNTDMDLGVGVQAAFGSSNWQAGATIGVRW
jgi:hypothetical protein